MTDTRPFSRLASMTRDLAGMALIVASDVFEGLGCVVRGEPDRFAAAEPPSQGPDLEMCGDCGESHGPLPVPLALPPELAALLLERRMPEPVRPSAGPEWSPAFADAVHKGDVVSLDGLGGRETAARVFTVRQVREHAEGELGYGSCPAVTLLLEDTVSGAVISPTLSVHQGVRVAPQVPDGVPADFAGGAS